LFLKCAHYSTDFGTRMNLLLQLMFKSKNFRHLYYRVSDIYDD